LLPSVLLEVPSGVAAGRDWHRIVAGSDAGTEEQTETDDNPARHA
jgi:hypothetical protein